MLARIIGALEKRISPHLRDRAEELLLGRRPFERLQLPSDSALTIVCDDGAQRDLDIVDALDRHAVKGVFAISPALVGHPGFLGFGELRALRAAGHEIAFHGSTHEPFTGFGAVPLRRWIDDGLQSFCAEELGSPRTLVYPFGRHNRLVREVAARAFDCAFTTWFGLNCGSTNRYAIRRIALGAFTGRLPASEAWYRGLLDQAARGHCWPTLMVHPGYNSHQASHTRMLSRLIGQALELGLAVRTASGHLSTLATPPAGAGRRRAPT